MYVCMYVCMYVWLRWVFVSARGPSPVVASGGRSSSRCAGLSLSRPLLLGSTGSRRAGSVVVAHGPSCPAACGILPDQGSNPCPLHWQADSQPLRHQGSPKGTFCRELFVISQSSEDSNIEMVGFQGGKRNDIGEFEQFEQINVKTGIYFSLVHFVLPWMVHILNKLWI